MTIDSLEGRISERLPALFNEAEQVAFYAHEFAQDKAAEHVGRYNRVASNIHVLVDAYRNLRMQEAQQAIAFVSEAAQSLMLWVLLCVVAACVLIGPIGLATMHNVLSRLRRITQAMAKLAANDTTTIIPSQQGSRRSRGDGASCRSFQGQCHPADRA